MRSSSLSLVAALLFSILLVNTFAEVRISSKTFAPRSLQSNSTNSTNSTTPSTPSDDSDESSLNPGTNSSIGFNLVNKYNFGFLRTVTFAGQPGKTYVMLFDTGSSNILTFSENFTTNSDSDSEPYGDRLYYSYDDLYTPLEWEPNPSVCPVNVTCTPATLTYDLGTANVTQYSDTVSIANSTNLPSISNQTVSIASYANANITNFMLVPGDVDGIYGIGLDENGTCPFLEGLYNSGGISKKYFSLFVTYDPYNTDFLSELIVEGYDEQYLNDSIFQFVPLADNTSWSINVDSLSTEQSISSIIASNLTADISSGTPYIGLPTLIFNDFMDTLNAAGITCDDSGPACQCPDVDFSDFPTLYIQSGSMTFAIPPEAYLTFDGSAGFANIDSDQSDSTALLQEDAKTRILQDSSDWSDDDSSDDSDDDSDDTEGNTDTSEDDSDDSDDTDDTDDDDSDEGSETYYTTDYGGNGVYNPFYGGVWVAPVYAYFPYDYNSYYIYGQNTPIIATGPITLNPNPQYRDLCWLNVQAVTELTNRIILGSPFLQTYYTLFDAENLRVGFGKTNQPVSLSIAGYQPQHNSSSSSVWQYFLIGFGVLLGVIILAAVLYCYCYKRKQQEEEDQSLFFEEETKKTKKAKREHKKKKHHHHNNSQDDERLIVVDYRSENPYPPGQVSYQPPPQGAYYAQNQQGYPDGYQQQQGYQQGYQEQPNYQQGGSYYQGGYPQGGSQQSGYTIL